MSDMNFDADTINKLKDMMNKGELNNVISQIPPEMMQNFSSMMNQNSNTDEGSNATNNSNSNDNTSRVNDTNTNANPMNNFDFSKIDMSTILKMQSMMGKMNNSNDPRSNLLSSLKPYLREERKGKLDQYSSLLNMTKLADMFKSNDKNKENNTNG